MHAESKPALEPSAEDQKLDLALEQAAEVEQALHEATPGLLLSPSRPRHPILPESSQLELDL